LTEPVTFLRDYEDLSWGVLLKMSSREPKTDVLVAQARTGDKAARQALLIRHRHRLRRMVAFRLDRRLVARIDPSDVVQEALLDAAGRLSEYLRSPPIPFYPWIRQLTWEHLVRLQQRHFARKRSVLLEEPQNFALSDESMLVLANQLVAPSAGPSNRLIREEMHARVREALAQLPDADRELLLLRYLEQLSVAEIAVILEIREGAVKMRHRRAIDRLSRLLIDKRGEESS
jgi:RNA polymerase sigma-70 factor (ECF subfamily)